MLLRNRADVRSLFWAFVLMPAPLVLGLWVPWSLVGCTVLASYTAYCAGILAHNQNHRPVFTTHTLNVVYSAWLSVFYGFPLWGWIPTHNRNHHRYLNGPGDVAATGRYAGRDTLGSLLTYPLRSIAGQVPLLAAYARVTWQRGGRGKRRLVAESIGMLAGHLGALALAVGFGGMVGGTLLYLLTVGLPAVLASSMMMLTNYLQHVGCDSRSPSAHSRNFTSSVWNWFVFDNGFHTVHHEHPGAHWSELRALHARRQASIDPALNQSTPLEFVLARYIRRAEVSA